MREQDIGATLRSAHCTSLAQDSGACRGRSYGKCPARRSSSARATGWFRLVLELSPNSQSRRGRKPSTFLVGGTSGTKKRGKLRAVALPSLGGHRIGTDAERFVPFDCIKPVKLQCSLCTGPPPQSGPGVASFVAGVLKRWLCLGLGAVLLLTDVPPQA